MEPHQRPPFSVGFVTGATPDKWAGIWRSRMQRVPLELVPLAEAEQEAGIRSGSLDMALVRLPIDREGLHCIRLYDEVPVVVASVDHVVAAFDEVTLADLADEQFVRPAPDGLELTAVQLEFGDLSEKDAIDVVASGTGVVVVPMSIARLHHRKDVVHRVVADAPETSVGLAWRTDHDNEFVQTFIGIVRGRSERSSRS